MPSTLARVSRAASRVRRERGGERRGRRRRCATLGWERGRMPSWPEKTEAGSARTGRLQKARETAAAILSFGRSIEI